MFEICKLCSKNHESQLIILPCCGYTICYAHIEQDSNNRERNFECNICKQEVNKWQIFNLFCNKLSLNEAKFLNKVSVLNTLFQKHAYISANLKDYVSNLTKQDMLSNLDESEINELIDKMLDKIDVNSLRIKINNLVEQTISNQNINLRDYNKIIENGIVSLDFLIKELDLEERLAKQNQIKNFKKWLRMSLKSWEKIDTESINCIIPYNEFFIVCSKHHTVGVYYNFEFYDILEGHRSSVYCAIDLEDDFIATGSSDETIIIWDMKTRKWRNSLIGHKDTVVCLSVLNKDVIISGSKDKKLMLWNWQLGQCLSCLNEHLDCVTCLDRLNFEEFVSGSNDACIKIWSYKRNECLLSIDAHEKRVTSVKRIFDDKFISSSEDGTIKMWCRLTGCLISVYFKSNVSINCMDIAYKDWMIVAGFNDGCIRVIELGTSECVKEIEAHQNSLIHLVVLRPGKILSLSSKDSIKIWN